MTEKIKQYKNQTIRLMWLDSILNIFYDNKYYRDYFIIYDYGFRFYEYSSLLYHSDHDKIITQNNYIDLSFDELYSLLDGHTIEFIL